MKLLWALLTALLPPLFARALPGPATLALAQAAPYRFVLGEQPLRPPAEGRVLSLRLRAWQEAACGDNALIAEYLDAAGGLLSRENIPVKAAPFEGADDLWAWVKPPLKALALRLVLEGQGPCIGTWQWLGAVSAQVGRAAGPGFKLKGLQLRASANAAGLELLAQGERIGSLALPSAWALQPLTEPQTRTAPGDAYLLQGPEQQRGLLKIGGLPAAALDQGIAVELQLEGAAPDEFSLTWTPADGAWLIPFNQGLRVPMDQADELQTSYDLPLRAGHFMSMPAIGWARGDASLLWLCLTPADAALRFRPKDRSAALIWKPSHGVWQGTWRMRLSYQPSGGVAAWSQSLRRIELADWAQGGVAPVTALRERQTRSPWLGRLAGAVNIHYWKRADWWSNEPHPEALAASMKAAGLDHALWSQKVDAGAIAPMKALGWLLGSYENFQDVYPADTPLDWVNKEGWPEQAVLFQQGGWMKGWPAKHNGKIYYAAVRSARAAVDYVHSILDARLAHGQNAVFLDTTTATGPVEDWSPLHPMRKSQDLRYKMAQLGYGAGLGLIVGSESGHDGALRVADYFEGMQSPWIGRFDDAGYVLHTVRPPTAAMLKWDLSPQYRAPLFDLAWHDSYVGYEYWGDAANRLPDQWGRKDLFSALYAQPQLWILDEQRWSEQKEAAIKSYRTWSPVVRHLFGQRMTDWKVLDQAGQIQETHWQDGTAVRVDFSKGNITLSGPMKSKSK